MVILPGSKNSIRDMEYLDVKGFIEPLLRCKTQGIMIAGICGGFQMLGKSITDSDSVESTQQEIKGLGLLDISTAMEDEKQLRQVKAVCIDENSPLDLTVSGS